MTDPEDLSADPADPVRALFYHVLDAAEDPRRTALELLAPAWDALDRAETAFLAHMRDAPEPRSMTAMADLCNQGCDLVADAARAAAAGEARSRVDEPLHRAADLAYLCALALPQLPGSVHPAARAVAEAFAVGHQPDLYTRVLDTLPPRPGTAPPEDGEGGDADPDARRFAVAGRAVAFDEGVREIRRAAARVFASMVPLARLAAVCLAGTRAPHEVAGGMRRDVALFVASTDEAARELLADLAAWLAGSPRHHLHTGRPSEWAQRLEDALDTLWKLGRVADAVPHGAHREAAAAAAGLRGEGALRWTEWAAGDVAALVGVLREHEDAVRRWHRGVGTADLLTAAGDDQDEDDGSGKG